jgi:hypothetical protein
MGVRHGFGAGLGTAITTGQADKGGSNTRVAYHLIQEQQNEDCLYTSRPKAITHLLRPEKDEISRSGYFNRRELAKMHVRRTPLSEVRCGEKTRRIHPFQLYLHRELNEDSETSILARTVGY